MKLIEKIKEDFTNAFKAREMEKKNFLGFLKSEVTKANKDPEDGAIVAEIKSMIKKAADSDSLSKDELEWLSVYLPAQLTESELGEVISRAISVVEANSMKDMGKVMARLKETHNGQYDGKMASGIIKSQLS